MASHEMQYYGEKIVNQRQSSNGDGSSCWNRKKQASSVQTKRTTLSALEIAHIHPKSHTQWQRLMIHLVNDGIKDVRSCRSTWLQYCNSLQGNP